MEEVNVSHLVFSPLDADYSPEQLERGQLIKALVDIEFISTPVELDTASPYGGLGAQRFRTGKQFFQLMTFLGCAPNIELEPRPDLAFCHLEIPDPLQQRTLISSRTLKPPLCPGCRSALTRWAEQSTQDHAVSCPSCGESYDFSSYVWRRKAMSYSRWRLILWNIYESEAVPAPALLECLARTSGREWSYSYITR
ncbi:MAG: hypothetical protein ACWA5X_04215 [bacterium]